MFTIHTIHDILQDVTFLKKEEWFCTIELFDRIYGRKSREKSLWGKNFGKTVPGQV